MRMTNEQFEAEVFRRSRAYQQKKQASARRFAFAALAFAGCFVCVFAAAKLLPGRNGNLYSVMKKDADNGIQMDQAPEKGEEACSEAYCNADSEESYSADAEYNDAAEAVPSARNDTDDRKKMDAAGDRSDNKAMEEQAAVPEQAEESEEPANETGFIEMNEQELFDYYGIQGLPETLADLPYKGTGLSGGSAGVQYTGAGQTPGTDANSFRYQDAGKLLDVVLQTTAAVKNNPLQPEGTILFVTAEEAGGAEKAVFRTDRLYVTVTAGNLPHETLEQAVKELEAFLSE